MRSIFSNSYNNLLYDWYLDTFSKQNGRRKSSVQFRYTNVSSFKEEIYSNTMYYVFKAILNDRLSSHSTAVNSGGSRNVWWRYLHSLGSGVVQAPVF